MPESQAPILAQENRAHSPLACGLSPAELEQHFAAATGENIEWLRAHEAVLLRDHPDWSDQYVVVASRTGAKILAIAGDRNGALAEGIKSPALLELARQEGVPPGNLLTALLIGETSAVWDW